MATNYTLKIDTGAKIQFGDGGELITGANSVVQMAIAE